MKTKCVLLCVSIFIAAIIYGLEIFSGACSGLSYAIQKAFPEPRIRTNYLNPEIPWYVANQNGMLMVSQGGTDWVQAVSLLEPNYNTVTNQVFVTNVIRITNIFDGFQAKIYRYPSGDFFIKPIN